MAVMEAMSFSACLAAASASASSFTSVWPSVPIRPKRAVTSLLLVPTSQNLPGLACQLLDGSRRTLRPGFTTAPLLGLAV